MFGQLRHVLMGFGKGLSLIQEARAGQEMAQGQSHVAAAIAYIPGIWGIYELAKEVLPQNRPAIGCSSHKIVGVVCAAGVITQLFLAVVKSGYYGRVVAICDGVENFGRQRSEWLGHAVAYCASLIPRHESECVRKVASFSCKNMYRIILSANAGLMLARGVKEPLYGIAALVGMGLDALDHAGYVPRSIRPSIRTWGKWSWALGGLFTTHRIIRVLHVIQIAQRLSPLMYRVERIVDRILHRVLELPCASLEEIDTPLEEYQTSLIKTLSFDRIQEILTASAGQFSINFVHSSKQVNTCALPSYPDLNELWNLFDQIDWNQHVKVVQQKCRTDDRFLDDFATACMEKHIKIERDPSGRIQNFDNAFGQLMKNLGKNESDFYLDWYRAQMKQLVDALSGTRRLLGHKQDWPRITRNCEHILAYLMQLEDEQEKVDVCLALAVEGGAYCALGVKTMTEGLMARIIGVNGIGEQRLFQRLEQERVRVLMELFRVSEQLFGTSADDVHRFEHFQMQLSFGFTPVTPFMRGEYSTILLLTSAFMSRFQDCAEMIEHLHAEYCAFAMKILSDRKEALWSPLERAHRIRQILGDALNGSEQGIIEEFWAKPGAQERFDRLLLVLLGVLKLKQGC